MAQRAAPSSATTASSPHVEFTGCTPATADSLASKIVQRSSPKCHRARLQLSPVAPLERTAGACDPLANSFERHRRPASQVTQRSKNSQHQVRPTCSFGSTTRNGTVHLHRSISAAPNVATVQLTRSHTWRNFGPSEPSKSVVAAHLQRPRQGRGDSWVTVVKPRLCRTFGQHLLTRQDLCRKLPKRQTQGYFRHR